MIDISIISTRRPALLGATLDSFEERLFKNIDIGTVYVNIDPIFGDIGDHSDCIGLLRSKFERLVIYEPEKASFGGAVKRVWSSIAAPFVFHLEDDWVALRPIKEEEILEPFRDPKVAQVAFATAEKNWDTNKKGHYHRRRSWWQGMGIKIPLPWMYSVYTTSPSVMTGEFARSVSFLLNPNLDPEKQFYSGANKKLQKEVSKFKSFILSDDGHPIIKDIGRAWRDERNIRKTVKKSISTWE